MFQQCSYLKTRYLFLLGLVNTNNFILVKMSQLVMHLFNYKNCIYLINILSVDSSFLYNVVY